VTHRSGTGPIELAILRAADTETAARTSEYIACHHLLPVIEEHTGLGPRYAYEALLDLARPWVIPAPLITVHGNMGDRDLPASAPRHVECRPSHAGQAVLDAEAGRLAPVPVGLINGTNYRGGTQPPLEPHRVITAVRHLVHHPETSDQEILDLAGPPYAVTGCTITGDLNALNAGHPITLRQTGQITRTSSPEPETVSDRRPLPPGITPTPTGPPPTSHAYFSTGPDERHLARAHLIIETLPPGTSPGDIGTELASHARTAARATPDDPRLPTTLPIGDLIDAGTSRRPIRIAITLLPGTNPDTTRDQLVNLDGITTQQPAAYPAPLATLLRTWTHQHRNEDITASLTTLRNAIQRDLQNEDH
jgi:hypothetical protein